MSAGDPASVRFQPADLEAHLVARARARAPGSTEDECIGRLARPAAALTALFTSERPSAFPDYVRDEDSQLAYALLFGPQTWTRVRFPLADAFDVGGFAPGRDRPPRILDLGAGIGAAGLSAAQLVRARTGAREVVLVAVDRSATALRALRATADLRVPSLGGIRVETVEADLAASPGAALRRAGPFDLVLASFALNEAFAAQSEARETAWLGDVADLLAAGGRLVIVEPALRETAARLRRVVEPLVAGARLHVHGPDLSGRLDPAPTDPRFHDHEVRRWDPPQSLVRLNARVRLSLRELTFAYLSLAREAPPARPEGLFRLTSPVVRTKGRWVFTGVGADAVRRDYELLDRGIDEAAAARLRAFERGDLLRAVGATDLGSPPKRRVPGAHALVPARRPDGDA